MRPLLLSLIASWAATILGIPPFGTAETRAEIIAGTSFEVPIAGSTSHDGSGGELGFTVTTTGNGSGSVVAGNAHTGSQSLLLSPNGLTTYAITFDPVDISGFADVFVQFYWKASDGWEVEDFLRATVAFDTPESPLTFLDLKGEETGLPDLNANGFVYVAANTSIPNEATTATLTIEASNSFNPPQERLFVDDITIEGTAVPEPSTLLFLTVGSVVAMAAAIRRQRRQT